MNAMKKVMALLLVFALAFACLPLGTVTAFATEMEDPQAPAEDVLVTEVTEETTEPVTESTEAPTEETEPSTEPPTEPSTEATEPVVEETTGEEAPEEETTHLLSLTEDLLCSLLVLQVMTVAAPVLKLVAAVTAAATRPAMVPVI